MGGFGYDNCKGNSHSLCYHGIVGVMVAIEAQGLSDSWCELERDAENLANLGGKVVTVRSRQSGGVAWVVVR